MEFWRQVLDASHFHIVITFYSFIKTGRDTRGILSNGRLKQNYYLLLVLRPLSQRTFWIVCFLYIFLKNRDIPCRTNRYCKQNLTPSHVLLPDRGTKNISLPYRKIEPITVKCHARCADVPRWLN